MTSEIRFLRRLSSCRFFIVYGKSKMVIKLLLRLRILRLWRPLRFSIF